MKLNHIAPTARAALHVKTKIFQSGDAISPEDLQLLEAYNQLRTDYVLQEKWPIHASGVDLDTYDVAANSLYIIAHVKDRVVAGMRATKVSSLFGSLSYSMWQFAVDRELFDKQLESHSRILSSFVPGEMWDITRLIAETSVVGQHDTQSKAYSRVGLLKVMSASVVGATHSNKSVWIFTTTLRMLKFMQKNHITVHVLASARISENDENDSVFCVVYPREIIAELRKLDPLTHRLATSVIKEHGGIED